MASQWWEEGGWRWEGGPPGEGVSGPEMDSWSHNYSQYILSQWTLSLLNFPLIFQSSSITFNIALINYLDTRNIVDPIIQSESRTVSSSQEGAGKYRTT